MAFVACRMKVQRLGGLEATSFLAPINDLLSRTSPNQVLEPLAVQGDGFCLFYAVAASCKEQASQDTARTLYACALETSLEASARFPCSNPFGDTAEERCQRALGMLAVDCYGFDLGDRTS